MEVYIFKKTSNLGSRLNYPKEANIIFYLGAEFGFVYFGTGFTNPNICSKTSNGTACGGL